MKKAAALDALARQELENKAAMQKAAEAARQQAREDFRMSEHDTTPVPTPVKETGWFSNLWNAGTTALAGILSPTKDTDGGGKLAMPAKDGPPWWDIITNAIGQAWNTTTEMAKDAWESTAQIVSNAWNMTKAVATDFINGDPPQPIDSKARDSWWLDENIHRKEILLKEFNEFTPPITVNKDEMIYISYENVGSWISSNEERLLLDSYGNRNSLLMLRMWETQQQAIKATELNFGKPKDNTPSNAFLHAYWNALMTVRFGEDFAKQYGDAHETTASNVRESQFMDLYNNEVGRKIGAEFSSSYAFTSTAQHITLDIAIDTKVMEALKNGELCVWDGENIYFSNEVDLH
jgi:hypothetical protein